MNDLENAFSLAGKTAFIAGASSGIGKHMARTFARAGARVVLAARREDQLALAVKAMREEGLDGSAVALDVTRRESVESALKAAVEALGAPVDILFNCAGILYIERFIDQSYDEVERVFDTNLKGAFLVAQAFARHMVEHGSGSIINVGSSSGLRAAGRMSSYGAAKAGLAHLSEIMALELASKGVRVNVLAPGNIETDMSGQFEDAGLTDHLRKRIPMKRFGQPGDLDGATLLLASEAGRYITGATIPVDGGQVLCWM
jgi:NAD(P)-dependent dehydrogenase (short-subunit alcohol dehydrogenase family)